MWNSTTFEQFLRVKYIIYKSLLTFMFSLRNNNNINTISLPLGLRNETLPACCMSSTAISSTLTTHEPSPSLGNDNPDLVLIIYMFLIFFLFLLCLCVFFDNILFSSASFDFYTNNFIWPTFFCDLSFLFFYNIIFLWFLRVESCSWL